MELFLILGFFLGLSLFKDVILNSIDPSIEINKCDIHAWQALPDGLRCSKCGKKPRITSRDDE